MIQELKELVRRVALTKDARRIEDYAVNSGGNYTRDFIDIVLDVLLDDEDIRSAVNAKLEAVEKHLKSDCKE